MMDVVVNPAGMKNIAINAAKDIVGAVLAIVLSFAFLFFSLSYHFNAVTSSSVNKDVAIVQNDRPIILLTKSKLLSLNICFTVQLNFKNYICCLIYVNIYIYCTLDAIIEILITTLNAFEV